MHTRLRLFIGLMVASLIFGVAIGAAPAFGIEAAGSTPDLVVGVVTSVHAHTVAQTGAIVTDVGVVQTLPSGGTSATSFTMQGGVANGKGMWTEQFADVRVGDSIIAGVTDTGSTSSAVEAPCTGRTVASSAVPGLASATDGVAAGYLWGGIKWADSSLPVVFYVNPSGLPAGATTAIPAAAQTWEDDPGSYFDYTYAGTTGTSPGVADDKNVIGAGSLASASTIAQCTIWYDPSTNLISEFDIVYNTAHSTFATDGNSSDYDLQGIGTHELGHNLHLLDLYDAENANEVMYGYGFKGDTSQRTLAWGDQAGIHAIYPVTSSTYSLSGNVTASGGGALSGASVIVAGIGSTSTDASGHYSISGLPTGTYSVTYAYSGYTSQVLSVVVGGNTVQSVALVPVPVVSTYSLSGTVTASGGGALAGVSVGVSGAGATTTDASGHYNLSGIASGSHTVTYSLSGYTTQALSLGITSNMTQSVALVAIPVASTHVLSGTVTASSGGAPLAGASVAVSEAGATSTDASGHYSLFGISAGTHVVTYSLAGYSLQTMSIDLSVDRTQDVALANTTATYSGLIRDAADGTTLPGVLVQIGGQSTTTDVNGQFAVASLPTGSYVATYSLSGYEATHSAVVLSASTFVNVTLERAPVTFSGRVVNSNGDAVDGATVSVGGLVADTSLSDGTFLLSGIPSGWHDVTYSHNDYVTRTISTLFVSGPNTAGDVTLAHVSSRLTLSLGASSVKKNRALRVSGTLTPRHADANAQVRISLWRSVRGKWRSYPSVVVSTTDNGTRTAYSRTVAFKYTGRWRLRASHAADSHHVASLSSSYVYVTVK